MPPEAPRVPINTDFLISVDECQYCGGTLMSVSVHKRHCGGDRVVRVRKKDGSAAPSCWHCCSALTLWCPLSLLLAGEWSCDPSFGGPVFFHQKQRTPVVLSAVLQSRDATLPLERRPALRWPLPISATVWISGSSGQSGATAETRKYDFFLFQFCNGSVFVVRCTTVGTHTSWMRVS